MRFFGLKFLLIFFLFLYVFMVIEVGKDGEYVDVVL